VVQLPPPSLLGFPFFFKKKKERRTQLPQPEKEKRKLGILQLPELNYRRSKFFGHVLKVTKTRNSGPCFQRCQKPLATLPPESLRTFYYISLCVISVNTLSSPEKHGYDMAATCAHVVLQKSWI